MNIQHQYMKSYKHIVIVTVSALESNKKCSVMQVVVGLSEQFYYLSKALSTLSNVDIRIRCAQVFFFMLIQFLNNE